MSFIENLFYLICTSWVGLSAAGVFDDNHIIVSTAIIDNGQANTPRTITNQV